MPNFFRLIAILRTPARYNLWWIFHGTPRLRYFLRILTLAVRRDKNSRNRSKGDNLCLALQSLGPIFIKFGQILSVRSDIVGQDMAGDLTRLQDKLPAFDGEAAVNIIEQSLNAKISELFNKFDRQATAAASIAQVHKAETPQGDTVAVKILRPDIDKIFHRDVRLLKTIAWALEIFVPAARRLRPQAVIEIFQQWTEIEMDLSLEAASLAKMKENFQNRQEKFHIPKVYWQYSNERILVTEWIDGFRIDDTKAMQNAGLAPGDIQASAARIFFMQIFYDGFFHADMHPGNIFVRPDGTIVPVDFGIMGHVDKATLLFLAELLIGFFQADYQKIADAHFDYGIVPRQKSRHSFALAMRAIGEPLQGLSLNEISVGRLLAKLFRTTRKFNMQTQPQLLLLQKTIFMSEALGRKLDPQANMWVLARPLIEDWILLNRSPEAQLWQIAKNIVQLLETLPHILENLAAETDTKTSTSDTETKNKTNPDK